MELAKQDSSEEPPPYTERSETTPCINEPPQENMHHMGELSSDPQSINPLVPGSEGYCTGTLVSVDNGQKVLTTAIMMQPGGYSPVEISNTLPPNYMGLSWFACLCCFWPLGLAAIIMSNQVDAAVIRGDLVSAHNISRIAKRLACCSVAVGCALIGFVVLRYAVLH